MRVRVSIDFETPRWLTKSIVVAIPVVVLTGVTILATARPVDFSSPPRHSATPRELNSLNAVTNHAGVQQYAVGATVYCGTTRSTSTGNLGGYAGARGMCRTSGVGTSTSTAHMCTAEEMIRSASLLLNPPEPANGWYAVGAFAVGALPGGAPIDDCAGWTTSDSGHRGANWRETGPGSASCATPRSIMCCDGTGAP
jgi:hypothetical protein